MINYEDTEYSTPMLQMLAAKLAEIEFLRRVCSCWVACRAENSEVESSFNAAILIRPNFFKKKLTAPLKISWKKASSIFINLFENVCKVLSLVALN